MSVILDQITVGDLKILVLDSVPNVGGGLDAGIGSLAMVQGQSGVYQKNGSQFTDWYVSSVDASQLQSDLTALDARLDIIEGPNTQAGSIEKALKDAKDYTDAGISGLVNSAPAVLDTLKELADALASDPNFATTISGQIGALDGRIDVLEADPTTKTYVDGINAALDVRLDILEVDPVTKTYVDNADIALDARLDIIEGPNTQAGSIQKAVKDAKDYADGLNSVESSARIAADNALDGRLDVLEADPTTKTYVDAADNALDARLDALELDSVTKTYVDAADSALNTRVLALEADPVTKTYVDGINTSLDARLDIIEGPNTQVGSIQKALKDAKDYTDSGIAGLVNSAPAVLDTLKELADALGSDPNFATTIAGQIGGLDTRIDALELDPVTKTYVDSADNALDARLDIVEGPDTQAGSIAKALKDAKSYADGLNSTESSARVAADNALSTRLDVLETDPVTKTYVDTQDALKLDLAGGTMTGDINLNGHNITGDAAQTTGLYLTPVDAALWAGTYGQFEMHPDTFTRMENAELVAIASKGISGDKAVLIDAENSGTVKINQNGFSTGSTTDIGGATIKFSAATISAESHRIQNVSTPTSGNDAANKTYVDTQDALKLNLAGGTMSGDLNMGSNDIVSVSSIGLGSAAPETIFEIVDNNVKFNIKGNSTSTTGSVNAVVATITPANNSVEMVKIFVTGFDAASNDSVSYEKTVRVKNNGGTISMGTIQSDYTSEDPSLASANCTFIVNASVIDVRVTGVNAKTITWKCMTHRMK